VFHLAISRSRAGAFGRAHIFPGGLAIIPKGCVRHCSISYVIGCGVAA
jgi:hypothetical protein